VEWTIVGAVWLAASLRAGEPKSPASYVDPFIGTASNRWFFFAPAAAPFGLVKLAPDSTGYGGYRGGGHPSGYRYRDPTLLGFSHLHEFQLGGFLLVPTTGELVTIPGPEDGTGRGWRSTYRKESEQASPGRYRVHLDRHKVTAELTATTRVGLHRYIFPAGERARVLVDVGQLLGEAGVAQTADRFHGALRAASVERTGPRTLVSSLTVAPSYAKGEFSVHASIVFDRPFDRYGAYRGAKAFPGRELITGFGAGYYVEFEPRENQRVEVQVGISFVSVAQAEANRIAEVGTRDFETVADETAGAWNRVLRRVQIEDDGPDAERNKVKLYTALWHVLLGRGIANDCDGAYVDAAGTVRRIPQADGKLAFSRYNSDALWGSFWNLNQVWALLYPEQMESFAKHLLSVHQESGWLPDGMVGGQFAPGMPSNQASVFLAAAYARRPEAFAALRPALWAAVWKNQSEWRGRPRYAGKEALAGYLAKGYVPCDDVGYGPTGHSLEYAYEDWAAAQLALQLGQTGPAGVLLERSRGWRRHWDPDSLHLRPRRYDGTFYEPFDPDSGYSFAEGTARQYRWFVPHGIPELIDLFGVERFVAELERTMAQAERSAFGAPAAENTAGYALGYNHGNQPALHAAWLFALAGRPEIAQRFVGAICDRFYGSTPEHGYGWAQDEDQGQLAAWYVLAMIGLFDPEGMVRPQGQFIRLSPRFSKILLQLGPDGSRKLTLRKGEIATGAVPFSEVFGRP
jgi:predicted alpha-1,2-mannosidase